MESFFLRRQQPAAAVQRPAKRQRNPLPIVDPETGRQIVVGPPQPPSATQSQQKHPEKQPSKVRRGVQRSAAEIVELSKKFVDFGASTEAVVVADCSSGDSLTLRCGPLLRALTSKDGDDAAGTGALSRCGVSVLLFAPRGARICVVCGACGASEERKSLCRSIKGRFAIAPTPDTESEDGRAGIVARILPRYGPRMRVFCFGSASFCERVFAHCASWRGRHSLSNEQDAEACASFFKGRLSSGEMGCEENAGGTPPTASAEETVRLRAVNWLARALKNGRSGSLPTKEASLANALKPLCSVQSRIGSAAAERVLGQLIETGVVCSCDTCARPTIDLSAVSGTRFHEEDAAMAKTMEWLRGHRNFSDSPNVRALRAHIACLPLTERVSAQSIVEWLVSSGKIAVDETGKLHPQQTGLSVATMAEDEATSSVVSLLETMEVEERDSPCDFASMGLTREIASGIVQHGFSRPTRLQRIFLPISIRAFHRCEHCIVSGQPGSGRTTLAVAAACNAVLARTKLCQAFLIVSDARKAEQACILARSFTQQLGTDCVLADEVLQRSSSAQLVVGTASGIAELVTKGLTHVVLRAFVIDDADTLLASPSFRKQLGEITSRVLGHSNVPQFLLTCRNGRSDAFLEELQRALPIQSWSILA